MESKKLSTMSDSFDYDDQNQQEFEVNTTSLESHNDPDSYIVDFMDFSEENIFNRQSIYKLHSFIKDRNVNTFEPLLVSIGPYHHGKNQLMPMEVHKRRALHHFMDRSRVPAQEYKDALMREVKTLQESYDQLDAEYWNNRDKFIEIMMVDGCFILEFMDLLSGAKKDDYAKNDPFFSYYGCIIHYNCVMRDMLLLENQLPYLVLQKLISVSRGRDQAPQDRVRAILSKMMMFDPGMDPGRHMLDMYMTGLFKGRPEKEDDPIVRQLSASELQQAGIQFKKITSFGEISYDRSKVTLNLPSLNINEYSISTFMNLKAFELQGTTDRHFNSYIRLMDSLVKSVEDVKLLGSQKIIMNFLDTDEEVVRLLKNLARDTVVDKNSKSYLARRDMTTHYDENRKHCIYRLKLSVKGWISNLKQTYFNSPWSIISVVAAACLLVLTALQTIYTIKPFYQGHGLGSKGP